MMPSSAHWSTTNWSAGAHEAAPQHPCTAVGPAGTEDALLDVAQRSESQRHHPCCGRCLRLGNCDPMETGTTATRPIRRRERHPGPASPGSGRSTDQHGRGTAGRALGMCRTSIPSIACWPPRPWQTTLCWPAPIEPLPSSKGW